MGVRGCGRVWAGWAWRSGACLCALNLLLAWAWSREWGGKVECGSPATPVRTEALGFHHSLAAAIEMFNFMADQRAGKSAPKDLDIGPQPVVEERCWGGTPEKPSTPKETGDWLRVEDEERERELYLFNAYADHRPSPIFPKTSSVIQVLSMARRLISDDVYCHLWGKDGGSVIVKGFYREIWQRAWDPRNRFYTPWLISCPVSSQFLRPTHVSISCTAFLGQGTRGKRSPCPRALSNSLGVVEGAAGAEELVVCVKGLDSTRDESERLVEWVEATFLLGASRILLYTYSVHPRTLRVIAHYEKSGRVQRIQLALPGRAPATPFIRSRYIWRNRQQKRRNEIIPYNDCLYRHLSTHKYLLIIDTDEVIVPKAPLENYTQLLRYLEAEVGPWTAYTAANAFFFPNLTTSPDPEIPASLYMLRHNVRSKRISPAGSYGKSFVNISAAATVFNHFPLHKQQPGFPRTHYVSPSLALKLHFKDTCPVESRDECPDLYARTLPDHSLAPLTDALVPSVLRALAQIFPSHYSSPRVPLE